MLREADEVTLDKCLAEVSERATQARYREDYATAMNALAQLRKPVDDFFDNVTVNCEDKKMRYNRLSLLSNIRAALDQVADFSKIEG